MVDKLCLGRESPISTTIQDWDTVCGFYPDPEGILI